jgi:D-cysteine desulfhydrase
MVMEMPSRIPLARTPTPLERLSRLGAKLGVELWVKRDDLTGSTLTGNKVRKLEFLLAEAKDRGADTVLTCGGAQSNHCRATALAATQVGLRARLLLRTADPSRPPCTEGNILLDRLAGAEIVWISPDEYRRRAEIFFREAAIVAAAARKPYVIPEGGSNALGAWGYVRAMEEMAPELTPGTTLLYACGSGGTGAGLLLGARRLGLGCRIVGVNVCDDRDYFVSAISAIMSEAGEPPRPDEIEILDGYVGRGYALSRPEELRLLVEVARAEGLVLDPVYTGKAFYALVSELARDRRAFGPRVVFLHTGGIFGLFPKAEELMPWL